MTDLPVDIAYEVLGELERLHVPYMLVGSVASSLQGVARSTLDADVVVQLRPEHLEPLRRRLEDRFYVSAEAMADALRRRSMFNLVHLASGFKLDIYVLRSRPFSRSEFSRRQRYDLGGQDVWIATPEDLILSKLDWYRIGREISERQWRDLIGLLQIHQDSLDQEYLDRWARELDLEALWTRARRESGGV